MNGELLLNGYRVSAWGDDCIHIDVISATKLYT